MGGRHLIATLPRARVAIAALVFALLAVACGGDEEPQADAPDPAPAVETSAPASGSDTPVCEAAKEIRRLDDLSQGASNQLFSSVMAVADDEKAAREALTKGLEAWRKVADETVPQLVDAYATLREGVPARLRPDVDAVADYTKAAADVIDRLRTVDDMKKLEQELSDLGAIEAGQAVLRLDEFTRDECDVVIAS